MQDGSEAWIPVQLVCVDGPQPFAHYSHLTDVILDRIRSSVDVHSLEIEKLYNKVVKGYKYKFDDDPSLSPKSFPISPPTFFKKSARISKDPSLMRAPCARKGRVTVEKRNVKINTIYISSEGTLPSRGDLLGNVLGGLASPGYDVTNITAYSKKQVLSNDFDVLSTSEDKFIFAVIDNNSWKDKGTRDVVRKLHRWADHDKGALLVCAANSHLTERYGGKHGPYFPASLRHKINYMLGRTNFDVSSLKEAARVLKGPLMIAGGHTALHLKGEHYLPSVTAVVANTAKDASLYLGSSQIHHTVVHQRGKAGQWVRGIKAVGGMTETMVNRFEAYKAQPQSLLFYHDSAAFDDEAHWGYCEAIQAAYKKVFPDVASPDSLRLTYVAVNKNTKLKYDRPILTASGRKTPLLDFVIDAETVAKHRYYVIRDDNEMTAQELVKFVSF